MNRRPLSSKSPRPRRPSRVLGYGARLRARPQVKGPSPRAVFLTELAAWLATTALAAALLLLLARHDLFLALPIVIGYCLFSWLLWMTRRRRAPPRGPKP